MQPERTIYIGIDLHKNHHTACIIDCWGKKLGEIKVENKPSAYPSFMNELKKYSKKNTTAVFGLEDVRNYGKSLSRFLVEQKKIVKEVNPALSSARRNSKPIPQKDDSWDAECVAKVLRDEFEALPDAKPLDVYWAINQLSNTRKGLLKNMTATVFRLHQRISNHYPSYRKFFGHVDGKTALLFWETYPSPSYLKHSSPEEIGVFIKQIRSPLTLEKAIAKGASILEMVHADGATEIQFQEQQNVIVRSLVSSIRNSQQEIEVLDRELKSLIKDLGFKLETMIGLDWVTVSSLISEIGDIHRFPSPKKLAMYAGIAPVVFGSGKKVKNLKNYLGNRELYMMFRNLAIKQITVQKGRDQANNPYLFAYFEGKIKAGKTRQQAYVCVMRKLVNVIFSLMMSKNAYVVPAIEQKQAG
nr:IS110 family transposase [Paenibacillus sp. SYP-B3998]